MSLARNDSAPADGQGNSRVLSPVLENSTGPGPLKVPTDQLQAMLGITSVSVAKHPNSLALNDTALA